MCAILEFGLNLMRETRVPGTRRRLGLEVYVPQRLHETIERQNTRQTYYRGTSSPGLSSANMSGAL
jgi:hypothetical protein